MSASLPMTTGPVLALRACLRNFWLADPVLPGLLGGEKIYDTAPRGAIAPYVTFGAVKALQWLGGSARGHEQTLDVLVWSRDLCDRECLDIAGRLGQISDGAVLTMAGYQLWPLRVLSQEGPQNHPQGVRQAIVTLRALSTPSG